MLLGSMIPAEMLENNSHASSPDTDLEKAMEPKLGSPGLSPFKHLLDSLSLAAPDSPPMLGSCQSLVKNKK